MNKVKVVKTFVNIYFRPSYRSFVNYYLSMKNLQDFVGGHNLYVWW